MATGRAAKSTRTVVVTGVPNGLLQDEIMADILTIHFQKSRNNGGDVEEVTYPTGNKGVAYITFEDPEVVDSVLKKEDHQLEDKRLSQSYPLRVTSYCENVSSFIIHLLLLPLVWEPFLNFSNSKFQVFISVTSLLDMSVFKDQLVLEDLVEDMKKLSTDLSFGPLQSNGQIIVQGSFPAFQVLTDFLLQKAESLSEKDNTEESKSHQRLRRRQLQEHRSTTERRNSVCDAHGGEKQVVVLDTDIYHYMKHFLPHLFQGQDGVVISDVTDGDITTVCVGSAAGARAGLVLSVRKELEDWSLKLHSTLRKESLSFKEHSGDEKHRYQQACESLKAHYPQVLGIPYDTHIEVIGPSSDIFKLTKEVSRKGHTR